MKLYKHQRSKTKDAKIYVGRFMTAQNLFVCRSCAYAWLRDSYYVTETFPLVGSSVSTKQLLCFVHGQGKKKREQKHVTKNVVEFHSHFPPATMISRQTVNVKTRLIWLENVQRWSKHLTLTELRTGMYPRLLPCEYWHSRKPVTSLFLFPSIRSCYKCKFVVRVD